MDHNLWFLQHSIPCLGPDKNYILHNEKLIVKKKFTKKSLVNP